ncbi:MAG TPA: hypothetical protein VIM60_05160 [Edaphobacter sp.]
MFERDAEFSSIRPDSNAGVSSALPSREEVSAEVEKILSSPLFALSDRLGRFLRFTTEQTLNGEGDALKEYVIGVSVYDRRPPYHPSQDSIVRTEARRLRSKLKEYYETEGKESRVFIYFQPGSYTPVFRRNVSPTNTARTPQTTLRENELVGPGNGVRIAVLPFVDLSHTPLSMRAAQGLTDELTHVFAQTDGIQIASRAAVEQMMSQPWDIPMLTSKLDILCVIEGTVRIDDGRFRITIRVVNEHGFQIGSHRFETLADPAVIAAVQEQVMTAFITRARPMHSLIRKGKASASSLVLAVYPMVIHGEMMLNEGTAADIQPALLKFREAIEAAPGYARAHYGIAQCYIDLAVRGVTPSTDVVDHAIAAAKEAVRLDPEMFGCYSTLATGHALAWQWKEADQYYAAAAKLGIHAPSAQQYALYLASKGRFEEGAEQIAIAQRIDPFSNRQKVTYAKFLHLARRFEELLASPVNTGRYGNVPIECKILTALSAAHVGSYDRALKIVDELQASEQPHQALLGAVAEILALSGEKDRAKRIVEDYQLFSANLKISCFRRALLALALEDEVMAVSLLEGAFELREAELVWLKAEPRLRGMNRNSSYQRLVEQVFPTEPQNVSTGAHC